MIHIYTGDGKGKTTAAVGLAVRAAGSGKKCCFFSFLKTDDSSEFEVLKTIKGIEVFEMPKSMKFVWDMDKKEKEELKKFYKDIVFNIKKSDYDVIVLDEGICAVCEGLAECCDILELSEKSELVITGRGICEELFKKADYITEMKKLKHPFDVGVQARKGIEF